MFRLLIQKNRMHYATITHLATRDYPLEVVTVLFLCSVCHYLGHTTLAALTALWLVISKTCIYFVCNRYSPFDQLSKDRALLALLGLSFANAILFVVPALMLASDPSIAMKLSAVLWVMGAQVYVTNTWSVVPTFVYTILLPIMLLMVITFFQLGSTIPTASTLSHWIVTFTFVGLFVYTSIDTLRAHLATEAALLDAERTATSRLSQLQETQRLDGLTGLLNRPAFDVALQIMLDDRKYGDGEVAVFLVDLDSFKPINDTYSHEAGDRVLTETAARLQTCIDQKGIVGRLGGDEFICAIQLDQETDVLKVADTLGQNITLPILWEQHLLKVTASIGIAKTGTSRSAPPATVPALCSAADQAMFAAKSSPTRTPVLYKAQLFAPRMTAEEKQALVDSIANEDIKPYYQPKIHLQTGQIIGFEALSRWEQPNAPPRSPGEFLPQIDSLGLQGDFMVNITSQVFRDVETILERGLDPGQVSLNIPEVALATFTGRQGLHRIIADRPHVAKHITFEITEDVFIARAADTIQASIASFRDLGLRISLDDFGTGFASFNHLRQLDFDELKIDTSFVSGLCHDTTSEVLVRGFLDIASGLGVGVIAEGVETEEQSQQLVNMGCLVAQGHLYSAALPFGNAIERLNQQQAA